MLPSISPTPAPLTFAEWTDRLRGDGFVVLPQSHAVPVDLWLREPGGRVLHLRARGTRLVLRAYQRSDFTTVLLRAECDCEAHRTAGAAGRLVLTPGAQPLAEVEYDGAAEAGWTGVAAGLLGVAEAAGILVALLARLEVEGTCVTPVGGTDSRRYGPPADLRRSARPASLSPRALGGAAKR